MNNNIQKLLKYPQVVRLFLKYPNRNFTILEIAKETHIPYATTWRHIQRLDKSGLLSIEKIGEYNVCRLNKKSPLVEKIKAFLELELSPHRLAVEEFIKKAKKIRAIEKIILFGSVARGEEKLTSDVDIALIGRKDKNIDDKIIDITNEVLEKTRIKIVPILLTKKEVKKETPLSQELNKGEVLYERTE